MLREIAIPKNEEFILHIPKEYVNKKIEFIAFPINEKEEEKENRVRQKKRSGYGVLKGKIHMSDDFDAPHKPW